MMFRSKFIWFRQTLISKLHLNVYDKGFVVLCDCFNFYEQSKANWSIYIFVRQTRIKARYTLKIPMKKELKNVLYNGKLFL